MKIWRYSNFLEDDDERGRLNDLLRKRAVHDGFGAIRQAVRARVVAAEIGERTADVFQSPGPDVGGLEIGGDVHEVLARTDAPDS
jgi:hypothetical protein